jgi:DNA-binding NarL/FixJ family response regulator
MKDKIRVVIFDDHPATRDNIEMLVDAERDMLCVATFPDCNDILLKLEKTNPDVIVMDIQMPGIDGIEGVKLIKRKYPEAKILMQTVFEDEQKVFESICAGASGYVLKKSSTEEIIKAIRDTYAGGSAMTPVIAMKVLDMFRNVQPQAEDSNDFGLTNREKEILSLLAKGKSYKMIADDCGISFYTVDSHIRKIYEKLHVHSMTEAINKARQNKMIQ